MVEYKLKTEKETKDKSFRKPIVTEFKEDERGIPTLYLNGIEILWLSVFGELEICPLSYEEENALNEAGIKTFRGIKMVF